MGNGGLGSYMPSLLTRDGHPHPPSWNRSLLVFGNAQRTSSVAMPLTPIGQSQYGDRRIARVTDGTFEGPKLSGTVHDGGGDWIINRPDGVTQLDVRLTMETADGALIYMTYTGLRHGPAG